LRKLGDDSEESILERIRGSFAGASERRGAAGSRDAPGARFVSLGRGDDAALVRPAKGYEIILTCDWFLEGTHFLQDKHPADSAGWKCLARAVSDVAAMGGVPRCFLLSLAVPKDLTGSWLSEFLVGLRRAAKRFGCALAGGDTTERREVLINVTVVGEVRRGRALRRSGARPGDIIYVSGRLGEAEMGLRLLRNGKRRVNPRDARLRKHLYPEPRVALGRCLCERRLATAMMDLSDGLSSDLRRLCEASGVGAVVDAGKMPIVRVSDSEQKDEVNPLRLALHGGDDYELLFTVPKSKVRRVPRSLGGVTITPIGEITRRREVVVEKTGPSERLEARGWDPFRRSL
jgi:thiamine-monophosphate kinase